MDEVGAGQQAAAGSLEAQGAGPGPGQGAGGQGQPGGGTTPQGGVTVTMQDGTTRVFTPERLNELIRKEGDYGTLQTRLTQTFQEKSALERRIHDASGGGEGGQRQENEAEIVIPEEIEVPDFSEDDLVDNPQKVLGAHKKLAEAYNQVLGTMKTLASRPAAGAFNQEELVTTVADMMDVNALMRTDEALKGMHPNMAQSLVKSAVEYARAANAAGIAKIDSVADAWKYFQKNLTPGTPGQNPTRAAVDLQEQVVGADAGVVTGVSMGGPVSSLAQQWEGLKTEPERKAFWKQLTDDQKTELTRQISTPKTR